MLRDIRHRLEYVLFRLLVLIVRLFPLDVATAISAWAWKAVAIRTRRHERALYNLERAMPEKSDAEREAIAYAMWQNLGRVMAETIQMDRLLQDPSRIENENPELISRYKNKLGASVFASLHMGNWEITVLPLHEVGSVPMGVYRIVDNPYVDTYIRQIRSALYPGGLLSRGPNDGFETVLKVSSYLRSGGTLGILSDLHDWKGIEVPFFGHPTKAITAPAWLARRAGTRLWVARCIRIGKQSRFRIAVKELKVPRTNDPNHDILVITKSIHRQFEEWIREHPEQWMWSNKRWPKATVKKVETIKPMDAMAS